MRDARTGFRTPEGKTEEESMKRYIVLITPFLFALGCGNGDGPEVSDAVAEVDSIGVQPLTDERMEELFSRLTLQLRDSIDGDFAKGSRLHLWRFTNRLRRGTMTDLQRQRVVGYLEGLMAAQPEASDGIEKWLFMTKNLMIGDVAPNIVGTDLDGAELELTDFRGKVTVLYFTGEWCGPCRSEYPHQRKMLEDFEDEPFAIVAVNSDGDIEEAREAKIDNELHYPAWFDGGGTKGPIATKWGVTGWPTVYILDPSGVIRFVGRRHEDTELAARYLLDEMPSNTE
jgi:peroxiredoxin